MDNRKDEKRNRDIIDLHKKGISMEKIGKIYDISRARVFQILEENRMTKGKKLDKN